MAQITLIINDKPGATYELADEPMTIGRTRDNAIAIRDRSMSRQHAELKTSDGQWFISDMDSRNGIEVNGEPTKRAELTDGDIITLGETTLRFRDHAPHVTPISVKVPKDLIKIADPEDEPEISVNDSRSDALARIDEIALPSEGDLCWEPITQIKITPPLGKGPGPGDHPMALETIVHHPADREPLMPTGDALMALARPHLAKRADLFSQVHASLLSATDAGVLWTEVLNLVRRQTEQPWAAVLMPPSKPGPLHLQLNGEGHRAQVPRVALECAIRSGHVIHWQGGKSDPLRALALAPWGDDTGVLGLVIAPTRSISPAEAIPLLDAIGGVASEVGQWWTVLKRRWEGAPAPGPRPLPPMSLSPPPPL